MDKESKFLLGLITFGLLGTLCIELLGLRHRPVILLIFVGISITALIYKLLGGFEGTTFGTPLFKLTGSGAFLFAFIHFINPILERQTFPERNDIFNPAMSTWMAVDKSSLLPIDTLKLKFMDFSYSSKDFGNYEPNNTLYFNVDENTLNIYKDEQHKMKLGKINNDKIVSNIRIENTIKTEKNEVFLTNIQLHQFTPSRTWFPYRIKPVQFDNNTTSYEIYNKDESKNSKNFIAKDEIKLRGSNIHIINNQTFLITIHRINHENAPYWVRFAVTELKSITETELK